MKPDFGKRLNISIQKLPLEENYRTQYSTSSTLLKNDGCSLGDTVPTDTAIDNYIKGTTKLKEGLSYAGGLLPAEKIIEISRAAQKRLGWLAQLKSAKKCVDEINQLYQGALDSEQHLPAYLYEVQNKIVDKIKEIAGELSQVEAIVLHIHSRLDMCDFCAPTLALELNRKGSIFQDMKEIFTATSHVPKILILVSSRLPLKNAKTDRRSIGVEGREEELDLTQQSIYVYQKLAGQEVKETSSADPAD